jgi:tetratricopeptide (TPR) repeat protein
MRSCLLLAVVSLAAAAHAAQDFQPSRGMIRFAEWAMSRQEAGKIEELLPISRHLTVCNQEPARLRCPEYLHFVAGYVQEQEAWRGPAEERDRWLDGALESYKASLKTFYAPSTLANIGAIHTARERYDLALAVFEEIEAMAPDGCLRECALAHGHALERTGRHDEALAAYRRADATLDDVDAARSLLSLLGALACRERRTNTSSEIFALSARLASHDAALARYALQCLITAAGPEDPIAATAATRWLDLAADSDDQIILGTLPPRAASELRLLLLGSTRVQDAVWWNTTGERRRAAARFLLARAKRADADRAIELASRAKEISPAIDDDPGKESIRADAVIELLYRHASARDDRREAIDRLAGESLAEFEKTRRPCARCVAQIGVVTAAAHRRRHRYAEAAEQLRRALAIESRWRELQPHMNLLLAEIYGAMQNRDEQREQLVAATAGYLDKNELDAARRALDRSAAAGLTDDGILLLRQIVAARSLLAQGPAVERGEACRLPNFQWVCGDTVAGVLDKDFVARQRDGVLRNLRSPVPIIVSGSNTSGSVNETITATSDLPSYKQRVELAELIRPIAPTSFVSFSEVSYLNPFATAGLPDLLFTLLKTPHWSGQVEYDVFAAPDAGPSFTALRGGERERVSGGGPLLEEKLWIFAAVDSLDFNRNAVGGTPNDSEYRDLIGRLTYTLNPTVTMALNGSRTDSTELNAGASPSRAPSAQQTAHRDRSGLSFVTDATFGRTFVARATAQHTRRRWSRDALSSVEPVLGPDGIWRDNINVRDEEISHRVTADGSGFFSGDSSVATVKGGVQFQRVVDTANRFTDGDVLTIDGANIGAAPLLSPPIAPSIRELWRSGEITYRTTAGLMWLYGELEFPDSSVSASVQSETWRGRAGEVDFAANRSAPALLPAAAVPASGGPNWQTFVYRLGGTYRKLSVIVSRVPSAPTPALVSFGQLDARDFIRTAADSVTPLVGSGIDPADPYVTSNVLDSALRPELTDSITARVTHTIFGIGFALSGEYRRTRDVMELRPLLRDRAGAVRPAEASDYSLQGLVNGAAVYYLSREIGTFTGGSLLTTGDRERRLAAGTLTASSEWGGVTVTVSGTVRNHRWHLGPEYRRFDDPTETIQFINPAGVLDADVEEDVAEVFFGSDTRALSYSAARWSTRSKAVYQFAPGSYEVTLGAELLMSEGHVRPAYTTTLAHDGRILRVRTPGPVERYPARRDLNASLHVVRPLGGGRELWTELRGSNLLDDRSDLRRIHDLRSPRFGALEETRLPRSFEVRFGFRWGVE